MQKSGIVYLVGAGPGDPGLITVKAVECLKKADVVVYDYLANPKFLDLAPSKARRIYVGKKGASHSKEQEEINALMIAAARRGKIIVRLKGGDPFVFGRGGEEAEALASAGVAFEVVPGVTSAIAVPAYAGIPVTHRNFGSSVAIVTGHEKDDDGAYAPDWKALAGIPNLVFLMGWANLTNIAKNLTAAGLKPETPAAVIEWGTTARQKTAVGTLATIETEVKRLDLRPPTVIVVGRIVSLRGTMAWFDKKPLLGRRVLVTRSRGQASELSRLLEEKGAETIEIPTIDIRPPASWNNLDRAIRRISRYDWIAFSSANGVEFFFERFFKAGKDVRDLKGVRLAAIGPATARPLEARGLRVELVADEFRSEALAEKLIRRGVRGKSVLLPQAKDAREVLREGLKKAGAKVETAEAYRSLVPRRGAKELADLLVPGSVDLMVFASSLTVENFVKMVGKAPNIPAACIGPVTARTARALGLNVAVVPKKYTMPDLVAAIAAYFSKS